MSHDLVYRVQCRRRLEKIFRDRHRDGVLVTHYRPDLLPHTVVSRCHHVVDLPDNPVRVYVNGHDCYVVEELVDPLGRVVRRLPGGRQVVDRLLSRPVLHYLESCEPATYLVQGKPDLNPGGVETVGDEDEKAHHVEDAVEVQPNLEWRNPDSRQ